MVIGDTCICIKLVKGKGGLKSPSTFATIDGSIRVMYEFHLVVGLALHLAH